MERTKRWLGSFVSRFERRQIKESEPRAIMLETADKRRVCHSAVSAASHGIAVTLTAGHGPSRSKRTTE